MKTEEVQNLTKSYNIVLNISNSVKNQGTFHISLVRISFQCLLELVSRYFVCKNECSSPYSGVIGMMYVL